MNVTSLLSRLAETVLSLVAPRRCPGCDAAGTGSFRPADFIGFCSECSPLLRPAERGRYWAAVQFEGPVREAVHRVKFSRRSDLGFSLGQVLARAWLEGRPEPPDCVMAVPLSARRLADRGFNQSSALARAVARALSVPARAGVLRRRRETVAQSSLGRAERAVNLAGAFQVVQPRVVRARSILVVDDVITTGSTFDEIVSTLRSSGAHKVECIALARAGRD